jgi:serine/threonine protein kinase
MKRTSLTLKLTTVHFAKSTLDSCSFSTVKLNENICAKKFTVKYFTRGIPGCNKIVGQIFARELEAFCHLRHPCIVQVYRLARKASGYEGAFVMEHMPNGSLDHVHQNVQQETPPRF